MNGSIPQSFIDHLLTRVDIIDIISSRITLKKTGRNYSALCPFHQEKSPSFSVNPNKQFYYCFGCGASGNAISFLVNYGQMAFPEAVEYLANQNGIEMPQRNSHRIETLKQQQPLYTITEKATQYYTDHLQNIKPNHLVISYLKKRGLNKDTCQTFRLGYAPHGWNHLKKHFEGTEYTTQQLITAGLLIQNEDTKNIYDRFRNRIIFPIRDQRGRYIGFGGRVLDNEKPKYLNSPESPIFFKGNELYGLYEAKQNRQLKQLIVVEGYMDVISLAQHGITHSVATLGTSTTEAHIKSLFRAVNDVVFCFDGDDAGTKAAWKALEATLPHKEDHNLARFLFLPKGEDPDTVIQKQGANNFLELIHKESMSLDGLLFKHLEEGLNLNTIDGRSVLISKVIPYISKVPSQRLLRRLLLEQLQYKSGLDLDYLTNYLNNYLNSSNRGNDHNNNNNNSNKINNGTPGNKNINGNSNSNNNAKNKIIDADQTIKTKKASYCQEKNPDSIAPHLPEQITAVQLLPQSKLSKATPQKKLSSPATQLTPTSYAIRQLICNPSLATEIQSTEQFPQKNDIHDTLLIELITIFKENPKLPISSLLAAWQNTPKGEILKSLILLDLGNTVNKQEFMETISRIQKFHEERKLLSQSSILKHSLPQQSKQLNDEQQKQIQEIYKQTQQRHGLDVETKEK